MKVLAISPLDTDSTVTIFEDARIVYAAAEERFSRVKQQDGFPWRALQNAFESTGTVPEEIDTVVYPFLTWEEETKLFERNLASERDFLDAAASDALEPRLSAASARVPARVAPIPGLRDPNERVEKGLAKQFAYRLLGNGGVVSRNAAKRASGQWGTKATEYHRMWQDQLESGLSELGLLSRLRRVEHHTSHAANAFFTSGFDDAIVATLDAYGSGLCGSISLGRDGTLKRLHALPYPHSLGTFYESVTSALGFRPCRHEGKIVGLAAYGDPSILEDVLLARVTQTPGDFRILEINNPYFARHLAARIPKIDVAAAYQRVLEIVAAAYVRHYVEQTGVRNVVLSGGVFANVKLNQRIFEIPGVERVFVHPNMGDGGCGTGAGLLQYAGHDRLHDPIRDVFLGPCFTDARIVDALQRAQLPYTRYRPVEPKVAQLIAAGKVVARFTGRMEYGPRALGNRSILYHAKEPAVNQWLNQRLGRTEFMPFAPATLYERRHECYKDVKGAEHAAQFMTLTFDCTTAMRNDSPAAVHVDGTARPQLVTAEGNPSFHRVLTEYERLTGIPSVINTSFNMHEEPIVCTPEDAVRAFLQGHLDYLAIGDFLVEHPSSRV